MALLFILQLSNKQNVGEMTFEHNIDLATQEMLMFRGKREWLNPDDHKGAQTARELATDSSLVHFRRMLSKFHVTMKPIEYKGYRYATAEHMYHAEKFWPWAPDVAL